MSKRTNRRIAGGPAPAASPATAPGVELDELDDPAAGHAIVAVPMRDGATLECVFVDDFCEPELTVVGRLKIRRASPADYGFPYVEIVVERDDVNGAGPVRVELR